MKFDYHAQRKPNKGAAKMAVSPADLPKWQMSKYCAKRKKRFLWIFCLTLPIYMV